MTLFQDLTNQIASLQRQVDSAETATREERAAHDVTKQQLDEINSQVHALFCQLNHTA